MGLDGEGGLAIALAITKAGKAQDELVDLLLPRSGGGERNRIGDVVEERAGDGEIGRLRRGIVSPCSKRTRCWHDDWRWAKRVKLEDAGCAGRCDQRERDVELRLRGYKGRPAVNLLAVEQGAALVAGGERVAEKDSVGKVAGIFHLGGLNSSERVGAAAGAAGDDGHGSKERKADL